MKIHVVNSLKSIVNKTATKAAIALGVLGLGYSSLNAQELAIHTENTPKKEITTPSSNENIFFKTDNYKLQEKELKFDKTKWHIYKQNENKIINPQAIKEKNLVLFGSQSSYGKEFHEQNNLSRIKINNIEIPVNGIPTTVIASYAASIDLRKTEFEKDHKALQRGYTVDFINDKGQVFSRLYRNPSANLTYKAKIDPETKYITEQQLTVGRNEYFDKDGDLVFETRISDGYKSSLLDDLGIIANVGISQLNKGKSGFKISEGSGEKQQLTLKANQHYRKVQNIEKSINSAAHEGFRKAYVKLLQDFEPELKPEDVIKEKTLKYYNKDLEKSGLPASDFYLY